MGAAPSPLHRRPLRARNSRWARGAARLLAEAGVAPDTVSLLGLGVAVLGGLALVGAGAAEGALRIALLGAAAAAIQLRLICNLLDGMIAIEHGRGGPLGPLWNEAPDRLADAVLLVGAGYGAAASGAAWAEPLGWLAALLAVGTAYLRELGRALGFASDYGGPGSKPRRMAVLTLAAVAGVAEPALWPKGWALGAGLLVVAAVSALTLATRTRRLAEALTPADGD